MTFRSALLALSMLCPAGCGGEPEPAAPAPAARAASRRVALLAVPLTAELPAAWDVRRGPGGALLLSGRAPSGERDVAMTIAPRLAAAALPATQPIAEASPGGPVRVGVVDRDGMRVIERFERLAPPGEPADVASVRWTIRYVPLGDGVDHATYELDVVGLTQLGFERDEETLRAIFDTVRPADEKGAP